MTNVLIGAIVMSMACGILALNCASYLALKLALDSKSSGLGLGLKGPGLGLSLEGPGLGLWILALTTTLLFHDCENPDLQQITDQWEQSINQSINQSIRIC